MSVAGVAVIESTPASVVEDLETLGPSDVLRVAGWTLVRCTDDAALWMERGGELHQFAAQDAPRLVLARLGAEVVA